jgi:DNA polymerase-3 subunit epsilon
VLVAHNASFDMGFLATEKEFCWGYIELPECFCTMRLSQHLWPTAFRHTLDQVAVRLQLPIPKDRHRAMPDVLLTADALTAMLPLAKVGSIEQLRKVAGLEKKDPVGASR